MATSESEASNLALKHNHLELLSKRLDILRRDKEFTDVFIIDGEKNEHPAHKNVLGASSEYFKIKIINAGENKIHIPSEISGRVLEILIKFAYTGELQMDEADSALIGELISAAQILKYDAVADFCSQLFLEKSSGSFMQRLKFADEHDNNQLKIKVVKMIAKDLPTVMEDEEFVDLTEGYLKMLLEQDETKLQDQEMVFRAILKWIEKDIAGREISLHLLEEVKWDELSDDFLDSIEDDHEDVWECNYVLKRVSKEQKNRRKKARQTQSDTDSRVSTPRSIEEKKNFSSIFSSPPESNIVSSTPVFMTPATIEEKKNYPSIFSTPTMSATMEKKNYPSIFSTSTMSATMEKKNYPSIFSTSTTSAIKQGPDGDPSKFEQKVQPLPTPRSAPIIATENSESKQVSRTEAVSMDSVFKLFENADDKQLIKINEKKIQSAPKLITISVGDEKSTLTTISYMDNNPNPKKIEVEDVKLWYNAAVCYSGKTLYIIGGRNDTWESFATFYSFDVETEQWTSLPKMSIARWNAGATALNDNIFVVGGVGTENNRLCHVEFFNSVAWQDIEPMKMCREKPAVSSFRNKVYVIGGYSLSPEQWKKPLPIETFASFEVYDVKTKQWTTCPQKSTMPIGRQIKEKTFLATVINTKLYAVRDYGADDLMLYQFDPEVDFWKDMPSGNCKLDTGCIAMGTSVNDEVTLVDLKGNIYLYKLSGSLQQVCQGIQNHITYAFILN